MSRNVWLLSSGCFFCQVKRAAHGTVAKVVSWSMRQALKGKMPTVGPFGEGLTGVRAERASKLLANGWKFAYFTFRADCKARKEAHNFDRSYQHVQICENCCAERDSKHGDGSLCFKDFYPTAAHLLTQFSHNDYLRATSSVTPWASMPGFSVLSVLHDPMHCIYLGTCKELIASALGYWNRNSYLVGCYLQDRLRRVSSRLKASCKEAGVRGPFKTLTPSNTGLDKADYPELGSSFKACSVKSSLWFYAMFSSELARSHPEARSEHVKQ